MSDYDENEEKTQEIVKKKQRKPLSPEALEKLATARKIANEIRRKKGTVSRKEREISKLEKTDKEQLRERLINDLYEKLIIEVNKKEEYAELPEVKREVVKVANKYVLKPIEKPTEFQLPQVENKPKYDMSWYNTK